MYQLILCFCDPLSWNGFTFCWFCDPLCCFSSPKWECVEPKLHASSRMLILCLSRINQSGHWKYTNQQFLSIKEESTNCLKIWQMKYKKRAPCTSYLLDHGGYLSIYGSYYNNLFRSFFIVYMEGLILEEFNSCFCRVSLENSFLVKY